MMFSFTMADIIQFSTHMSFIFGWKIETGKVLSIILVTILLIYLNVPEKLKHIGLLGFFLAILLLVSVCFSQAKEYIEHLNLINNEGAKNHLQYNYMVWVQSGSMVAATFSSMGNNTTIFIIRKTSKKETLKSFTK